MLGIKIRATLASFETRPSMLDFHQHEYECTVEGVGQAQAYCRSAGTVWMRKRLLQEGWLSAGGPVLCIACL